jgi:hypothetical protein
VQVADAIQDGVGVIRRAAKQGGDAAEEFLDEHNSAHPAAPCANCRYDVCGWPYRGNVNRLDDEAKVDPILINR